MAIYKNTGKRMLFDESENAEKLTTMGNPLEMLSKVVDFEYFRPFLEESLVKKDKKSNAGAKPFDVVMMFKILVLQRYYGLSDREIEYQIIDRSSFKKFLGLGSGDKVPDEKTIWAFRENLTKVDLVDKLFDAFRDYLASKGLIANEGKIIDASFTVAPKQRNSRDENEKIKEGKGDELWNDQPQKKSHKDTDARWTKKYNETFYGYKNHTKVDEKSKFIDKYAVTDASVHDSQVLGDLLTEEDRGQELYADSAYTGQEQEKTIQRYGMVNKVQEQAYRNTPLSDEQKMRNREKSKKRVRVEHVYGYMEQSMKGLVVKCVGIARASATIGLMNLTYNLFRYEQIVRLNLM